MPTKINVADYIGKKYGKLTIISINKKKYSRRARRIALAKCECGNIKEHFFDSISCGRIQSCGCVKGIKHGLTNHPLRGVWKAMKRRCTNPKDKEYKNYGGRGIKLGPVWLNDFVAFYKWAIRNGWKKGLQVDRTNNSGNYEPSNCRFVTPKVNVNNKRNTVYVIYNGQKVAVQTVLKINNIKSSTFHARLSYGWPIEKAMSAKLQQGIKFRT